MSKEKKKGAKVVADAKCSGCGRPFASSKFTPYQKFCPECAKKRKMIRIKSRNVFRKKVASLPTFKAFMPKSSVDEVASVRKKLLKRSTSQRFQFFKAKYSKYVASVKG